MKLKDEIKCPAEGIDHRVVVRNNSGAAAIVAFAAGAATPVHMAEADVLLTVLEGSVKFKLADDGKEVTLNEGDFTTIAPALRHTVSALTPAKVLLVKLNA